MISLAGIVLDDNISLKTLVAHSPISINIERTIGGAPVLQHGIILGGEILELYAYADGSDYYGYFTTQQIEQLKAFANFSPVSLIHPAGNYSVYISGFENFDRLSSDDYIDIESSDKWIGTIFLINNS